MKKKFIRWKVYMDRSRGYMGIIQFIAVMYLSIGVFFEKHHLSLPSMDIIAAVVGLLIGLLVVGRYDFKWGFFQEENRRHTESNPVMADMINDIKEIKNSLDGGQQKKSDNPNIIIRQESAAAIQSLDCLYQALMEKNLLTKEIKKVFHDHYNSYQRELMQPV